MRTTSSFALTTTAPRTTRGWGGFTSRGRSWPWRTPRPPSAQPSALCAPPAHRRKLAGFPSCLPPPRRPHHRLQLPPTAGWNTSAPGFGGTCNLTNWYDVWDKFNTFTLFGYGDPTPDVWAGTAVWPLTGAPISHALNASFFPLGLPATVANAANTSSTGFSGSPPAAITGGGRNRLLSQITWLAGWLETSKMASNLTGALLAGPTLADLAARIADALAFPDPTSAPAPRLVEISAHYNLLLGLLGALKLDVKLSLGQLETASLAVPATSKSPQPGWLTVPSLGVVGSIPLAASLLAFELHRSAANSSLYAVRLVAQNSAAQGASPFYPPYGTLAYLPYGSIPLPCASAAGAALGGDGACTLDDFRALIAPALAEAGTTAAWCSACGPFVTDPNKTPMPMSCQAALYQQSISTPAANSGATRGGTAALASLLLFTMISALF